MRRITKNAEPHQWTAYRLTPGAAYVAIPELRQSLLEEQGRICAYCMRRIDISDGRTVEKTRIEHILSRENHSELQLDYSNMALCCDGQVDSSSHCDVSKTSNDVTFNLYDDQFFTTLSYGSKTGEINCSNTTYRNEINTILNLNHRRLKANRCSALKGVIQYLNRKGWTAANIRAQFSNWDNRDGEGKYKEYCGIVVWYLQRKLTQNIIR